LATVDRAARRVSRRQRAAVRNALASPRFALLVLELLAWSEPRGDAQAASAQRPPEAAFDAAFVASVATSEAASVFSPAAASGGAAVARDATAAAPTLERFARKAVRRATRRLLADANGFAELSTERRHRVRIRAKRLRYALDLFPHALPRGRRKPLLEALKGLQEALGALNDVAQARAALARLRAAPALRAAAEARWAAAADEQLARAAGAFAALRRNAP
jgi:CHAD domain-containing protein